MTSEQEVESTRKSLSGGGTSEARPRRDEDTAVKLPERFAFTWKIQKYRVF